MGKPTVPPMVGIPDQLILGSDNYVHFLICYKYGHIEFDGGMIRQVPRYIIRMHKGGLFDPKASILQLPRVELTFSLGSLTFL